MVYSGLQIGRPPPLSKQQHILITLKSWGKANLISIAMLHPLLPSGGRELSMSTPKRKPPIQAGAWWFLAECLGGQSNWWLITAALSVSAGSLGEGSMVGLSSLQKSTQRYEPSFLEAKTTWVLQGLVDGSITSFSSYLCISSLAVVESGTRVILKGV